MIQSIALVPLFVIVILAMLIQRSPHMTHMSPSMSTIHLPRSGRNQNRLQSGLMPNPQTERHSNTIAVVILACLLNPCLRLSGLLAILAREPSGCIAIRMRSRGLTRSFPALPAQRHAPWLRALHLQGLPKKTTSVQICFTSYMLWKPRPPRSRISCRAHVPHHRLLCRRQSWT